MKTGALAATAVVLAGLLFPVQSWIDAHRPARPSSLLYTPDRRLMKVIACGHGPLLAELVWIHSNNYVIEQFKRGRTHIEYLYNLYDTITELDPNAVDAYVLGAIFLSSVAQEPDESLRLLQKGQGAILEVNGKYVEDPSLPGRAHPEHPLRWKLLNECAATHLVCFASAAPTADERQDEIQRSGRIWQFGAERYPRSRYATVPDWFEEMGRVLSKRRIDAHERARYREAVSFLTDIKIAAAGADSPVLPALRRTKLEVESRFRLETLETALWRRQAEQPGFTIKSLDELLVARGGSLEQLPDDPLGVGYTVRDGKIVAPALDAARVERDHARRASEFHLLHERWPASLDELRADLEKRGIRLQAVPSWVVLEYDAASGEVKARGER